MKWVSYDEQFVIKQRLNLFYFDKFVPFFFAAYVTTDNGSYKKQQ